MSEIDDNSCQLAELLADELFEYCKSDDISEEGIHQIIERHKESTPNNDNEVSDYRFFHSACSNERVTEGIIRCLLEYFPAAASDVASDSGRVPLHFACGNKNASTSIIRLLIDAAPDSVRHEDITRCLPLHWLCGNTHSDETAALQILKLLLKKHPEIVRHVNNKGRLPIHIAVMRTPEFCRVLINAYPGSEIIADSMGWLPLHHACVHNTVEIVEYLYKLYPNAIDHTTQISSDLIDRGAVYGAYPIHHAAGSVTKRASNHEAAVDIVKFLLNCDPRVKHQKAFGLFPTLLMACFNHYSDTNIGAGVEIIKAIYDAAPEAIGHPAFARDGNVGHPQVQAFVNRHLVFSRLTSAHFLMTTPYENGQLQLHRSLQNNIRLGSIKLLVKANPLAVQSPDNSGALPLHVACMHHESASVIQYLLGLDMATLNALDHDDNTALHYACRGAKYDTIALLLETYDAVSVSRRNNRKKFPIEVLWENSFLVVDRESIEYTESSFGF